MTKILISVFLCLLVLMVSHQLGLSDFMTELAGLGFAVIVALAMEKRMRLRKGKAR